MRRGLFSSLDKHEVKFLVSKIPSGLPQGSATPWSSPHALGVVFSLLTTPAHDVPAVTAPPDFVLVPMPAVPKHGPARVAPFPAATHPEQHGKGDSYRVRVPVHSPPPAPPPVPQPATMPLPD